MQRVGSRIVESNETVLGIKEIADRFMDQAEQLIKIMRRIHALNDVKDRLAFLFHALAFGKIDVDCKHAYRFLVNYNWHAVDLDWDQTAIFALPNSLQVKDLSTQNPGRERAPVFALRFGHDDLVDGPTAHLVQREL